LEVILKLSDEEKHVRITDIANSLNITKASVTETIDLLIEQDLVTKEKYGPVTLTSKGKREAKKVKKMHKVIYEFLIQSLNVTPETADKDACMIEHVISKETITKMIDFLEKTEQACAISKDLNLKKARTLLNSGGERK
jgi:DtxR family Mn-dependent transcriptional regulator